METSDSVRHYADEEIDISYDAHRCIHAAECISGLPAVFEHTPAVDHALRSQRGRDRQCDRAVPERGIAIDGDMTPTVLYPVSSDCRRASSSNIFVTT